VAALAGSAEAAPARRPGGALVAAAAALGQRPGGAPSPPPCAGGGWKQLSDYGEVNSASTAQVAGFLGSALTRFPPAPDRKYMLVFWDHGSGWEGFGGRRAGGLAGSLARR
jgi:hypothetical protein